MLPYSLLPPAGQTRRRNVRETTVTEPFPAALQEKVRDFIATLKASMKVRRFAEAYLDHVARGGTRASRVQSGTRATVLQLSAAAD
jgi:hypothetical protein